MTSETNVRSSQGATGLAGVYFSSPDIYAQETRKIFEPNWLCVGRSKEVDSAGYLKFEIEGHPVFACRDDDGRIRVFQNFCRHRGSQLITGDRCGTQGDRIRCPYHAWTYDREGRLVTAPNMKDVDGFSHADNGLLQIECDVWNGFLWVRLNSATAQSETETLAAFLRPLDQHATAWSLELLEIGAELAYDVEANWKLIFQNYNECYHCPSVHPALNRLTPYKGSHNEIETGPIMGGPMKLAEDCSTMSTEGVAVGLTLPELSVEQSRSVAYYTLFPSMFLSFHPDYVLVHRLTRSSVDKTSVACQFLFHPETLNQTGFDPTPAVEFWDLTNRQDWRVCELAQQGVRAPGYVPGPYSNLESVVAAFDQHYLDQLKMAL